MDKQIRDILEGKNVGSLLSGVSPLKEGEPMDMKPVDFISSIDTSKLVRSLWTELNVRLTNVKMVSAGTDIIIKGDITIPTSGLWSKMFRSMSMTMRTYTEISKDCIVFQVDVSYEHPQGGSNGLELSSHNKQSWLVYNTKTDNFYWGKP